MCTLSSLLSFQVNLIVSPSCSIISFSLASEELKNPKAVTFPTLETVKTVPLCFITPFKTVSVIWSLPKTAWLFLVVNELYPIAILLLTVVTCGDMVLSSCDPRKVFLAPVTV